MTAPHARTSRSLSGDATGINEQRAVPRHPHNEKLTIPEVCAELGVSRSTFYHWRQIGKAPRCIKLLNGDVRVRRADLNAWLATFEEIA